MTETVQVIAGEPAMTDPGEAQARAALGQLRTEIGKAVVGQDGFQIQRQRLPGKDLDGT